MNEKFTVTDITRVFLVGKEEYGEVETTFGNNLSHNELIFHFSGKTTVIFNGRILETEPNVIRFLPKGKATEYKVLRKERGECIDVCFDTDLPVFDEACVIKCKKSDLIGNLFKKLFSSWVAKGNGYYFECVSLLYAIFAEMQKHNNISENQYLIIKPAINYIKENIFKENISVNMLAKRCKISASYLKKLFIKQFGMSPATYIINLKINYACDLLKTGVYTVGQVAEMCGYNSMYYFSRQFKAYMNISPSEFIKKYKSSK